MVVAIPLGDRCFNTPPPTPPRCLAILRRFWFFDENYKSEDAINRRLYNNHCFVLTAIYRASYPNRTVLRCIGEGLLFLIYRKIKGSRPLHLYIASFSVGVKSPEVATTLLTRARHFSTLRDATRTSEMSLILNFEF
jgi:hypothetical protein